MITDLIFDFFGTLVNYDPRLTNKNFSGSHNYLVSQGFSIDQQAYLAGWSEAFAQLEQQAQVDCQEYPMRAAAQRFLANTFRTTVSEPVADTLVELFLNDWNTGVTYFPGIKLYLTELAGDFRLSIITNTHYAPLIDHHLVEMGIAHLFCLVIKSVEHGLRKPHPQIFTDTLAQLGIGVEQAIYIGDSFENDYQGAQAAGLKSILIDRDRRHLHLDAARVDHLYDIKYSVLWNGITYAR